MKLHKKIRRCDGQESGRFIRYIRCSYLTIEKNGDHCSLLIQQWKENIRKQLSNSAPSKICWTFVQCTRSRVHLGIWEIWKMEHNFWIFDNILQKFWIRKCYFIECDLVLNSVFTDRKGRGAVPRRKAFENFVPKTDLALWRSGNIIILTVLLRPMQFSANWIDFYTSGSSLYHKDWKKANYSLSMLPHDVPAGGYRNIIAWWKKLKNGRLPPCRVRCFWSIDTGT